MAAIIWRGTPSPRGERDQRNTFNKAGMEDRRERMS
jgi:hypothetical protein